MLHDGSTSSIKKRSYFGISTSMLVLNLLAGIVITNGGMGCEGSLGGECMLDSDCSGDLICVYEFCHQQCANSKDCKDGEICFVNKEHPGAPGYCEKPAGCELSCDCNTPISKAQVCRERTCRDSCESDMDCTNGQQCFSYACYDTCDSEHPCLVEGQMCYEGKCAQELPGEVAGELGTPCKIPTDCASVNCANGVCVGCKADVDCGGRVCNNPDPNDGSKGTCGVSSTASVPELPSNAVEIPVEGLSIGAFTLDSQGQSIYFCGLTANSGGIFKITPDSSVMQIADLSQSNFYCLDMAISYNDKILYVAGYGAGVPSGVFALNIDGQPLIAPFPDQSSPQVEWAKLLPEPNQVDVRTVVDNKMSKKDVIYVSTTKNGKYTEIFYGEFEQPMPDLWITGSLFSGDRFATGEQQIVLVPVGGIFPPLGVHFLGVAKQGDPPKTFELNLEPGTLGPLDAAFDMLSNTIYVFAVSAWDSSDRVYAIDSSTGSVIKQYALPKADPYGSLCRARDKNVFLTATESGGFYRFELPNSP